MANFVQSEMKVLKLDGAILILPETLETFWNKLGDIPVDDEKYPGGVAKLMNV